MLSLVLILRLLLIIQIFILILKYELKVSFDDLTKIEDKVLIVNFKCLKWININTYIFILLQNLNESYQICYKLFITKITTLTIKKENIINDLLFQFKKLRFGVIDE